MAGSIDPVTRMDVEVLGTVEIPGGAYEWKAVAHTSRKITRGRTAGGTVTGMRLRGSWGKEWARRERGDSSRTLSCGRGNRDVVCRQRTIAREARELMLAGQARTANHGDAGRDCCGCADWLQGRAGQVASEGRVSIVPRSLRARHRRRAHGPFHRCRFSPVAH